MTPAGEVGSIGRHARQWTALEPSDRYGCSRSGTAITRVPTLCVVLRSSDESPGIRQRRAQYLVRCVGFYGDVLSRAARRTSPRDCGGADPPAGSSPAACVFGKAKCRNASGPPGQRCLGLIDDRCRCAVECCDSATPRGWLARWHVEIGTIRAEPVPSGVKWVGVSAAAELSPLLDCRDERNNRGHVAWTLRSSNR
jgi:hypothetical protein